MVEESASRRRPFRWLAPTAIVALSVAMAASEIWAVLDPGLGSTPAALIGFASLVIASFWTHAALGVLAATLLAAVLRQRSWYLAGSIVSIAIWGQMLTAQMIADHVPGNASHSGAEGADSLAILSVNLLYGRGDIDALLGQIDALSPDLVLLQEYTHRFADEHRAAFASRYPHAVERPRSGAFGQATFSRLPFVAEPDWAPATAFVPSNGWPPQIETVVEVGGQRVAVVNIHLLPPTGISMVRDQDTMSRGLVDAWSMRAGPAVLAGDFNSNIRGLPLRRLLRDGFISSEAGRFAGVGATWPRTGWLRSFPGTRLDHVVFRGDALTPIGSGRGADIGSDHLPVWATFEVIQRHE